MMRQAEQTVVVFRRHRRHLGNHVHRGGGGGGIKTRPETVGRKLQQIIENLDCVHITLPEKRKYCYFSKSDHQRSNENMKMLGRP